MDFLAGFAVGVFCVTILPITIFWVHCRIMGGRYNNSNTSKAEDD